MGHLIEKKYQVTGHYLCMQFFLVCPELPFMATVQWQNKKLRPVIGRHLDTTTIILSLGIGSHLYNNFVRCGSIFFVHAPNELYLHLLSC